MTAQTLPDEPNFCLVPAYDIETEVQQIRIVTEGLDGHVPTALIALHLDDALSICDKLDRRLASDLLVDAAGRCLAAAGVVGARAIVVQAIDERAAAFYAKFGFRPFSAREPLMLVLRTSEIEGLVRA